MHGTIDGLDVRVFGLFHVVGRGRFRQTLTEACATTRVPGLGFWFRVEPWGRYGLAKPLHVPHPTGDPEFDSHWAADAPDDATMHAVLDGSFRTFLTARAEKPYVGANDGWVLVAARGRRPDRLTSFVHDAVAIARRLAAAPETTARELLAAGDVARAEALLDAVPNDANVAGDPDMSLRAEVLAARAAQLETDDPGAAAARYRRAADEQRAFASTATSGGEGLARSRVTDELLAKATHTRA